MDRILIKGGAELTGTIEVSGAKNAALPLMAASLLSSQPITLRNIPHLADIGTMATLLGNHGVRAMMDGLEPGLSRGKTLKLDGSEITSFTAPYDIVRKMRASILVLGPLLARFGQAKVSLPGGCAIGTRPVDMHLKALTAMGAQISLDGGYISAIAPDGLRGALIVFDKISVGATENILMAASLADGITTIENAAREPEIVDLAALLTAMGADITGAGGEHITIKGAGHLHGATHEVVADRIEAGTFAAAVAITGGDILLENFDYNLLAAVFKKFNEAGVKITQEKAGVRISMNARPQPVDISTEAFPGFPTDMQAQAMAVLSTASGASVITENIFENRFMHVSELTRMGANVLVQGNTAVVRGIDKFKGADVMATDLRASSSLVLAGLAAQGETIISRVYHLDRGYERMEEKLSRLGASITRIKGD